MGVLLTISSIMDRARGAAANSSRVAYGGGGTEAQASWSAVRSEGDGCGNALRVPRPFEKLGRKLSPGCAQRPAHLTSPSQQRTEPCLGGTAH